MLLGILSFLRLMRFQRFFQRMNLLCLMFCWLFFCRRVLVYIMMLHRMFMNSFVVGWWGGFVWIFYWMFCLMRITFVRVEMMFIKMSKRWMVITEPKFVTMSRIVVSKRCEGKLWCLIIVTRVRFKLVFVVERLMWLVVLSIILVVSKLWVAIIFMLITNRPVKLLLIFMSLLIWIIVMFPLIFMSRCTMF